MKNLMILLVVLLSSMNSWSQTINGKPLAEIDVEYMQIVGRPNVMGTKVSIGVDYGQERKTFENTVNLEDEDGKKIELNSMVDALNFFSKYGYEFVTTYTITIRNQNVYHYLLRKSN